MLLGKKKGVDAAGSAVDTCRECGRVENESWGGEVFTPGSLEALHAGQLEALREEDSEIYGLIEKEYKRQRRTLALIAAENQCSKAVLAAIGTVVQDKTTEGFVGARFHGGCEVVDDIETLAVERAKKTFLARFANVQPHSGTAANQIVLTAVLEKGDRILSLGVDQGGHLSHGAKVSFTGKFFEVENYNVDRESYLLDYVKIREQAVRFCPKMIICGATAYAREIDFSRFRAIADEVGAYLLADISHISSLVIGGAHMSPVDHAHFTTTSTYKPGGPRGGLILMGRDFDKPISVGGREVPLWSHIEKMTFPGFQGTPYLNHIAAKAVFFNETMSEEYRARQFRIIANARRLAANMVTLGYDVLTGGTDNHMVLINVLNSIPGMTGLTAQQSLELCGIIVNKNRLPYDIKSATVTSGLRLGTPIVSKCGMGADEIDLMAAMIDKVLRAVKVLSDTSFELDEAFRAQIEARVCELCERFLIR
ncbi:MAG: serine hydroxymethyltransferase [Candidatus Brocadiia bacterium]|nr:MAG: serine hydroxymethyltransferase [Candidatus Brocadiia bacterium]